MTDIAAGQRWRSKSGEPDIQIAGRAANIDGWAITSPGVPIRIVPTTEIVAGYVLVEEFKRAGTG